MNEPNSFVAGLTLNEVAQELGMTLETAAELVRKHGFSLLESLGSHFPPTNQRNPNLFRDWIEHHPTAIKEQQPSKSPLEWNGIELIPVPTTTHLAAAPKGSQRFHLFYLSEDDSAFLVKKPRVHLPKRKLADIEVSNCSLSQLICRCLDRGVDLYRHFNREYFSGVYTRTTPSYWKVPEENIRRSLNESTNSEFPVIMGIPGAMTYKLQDLFINAENIPIFIHSAEASRPKPIKARANSETVTRILKIAKKELNSANNEAKSKITNKDGTCWNISAVASQIHDKWWESHHKDRSAPSASHIKNILLTLKDQLPCPLAKRKD